MYKQTKKLDGTINTIVIRVQDNVFIPFDLENIDYKAYLKWLSEGNTPLPPDQE